MIGLVGVIAPTFVLGAAIWGYFNSGGSLGWIIQLAKAAVDKAGAALLTALHAGMNAIINSLVHVNPWVRFILDMFEVVVDIAYLVIGAIDVFKEVMARGPKGDFFKKLGNILQKIRAGQTGGVYGQARDALGFFIGNTIAGFVFLALDANTAFEDLQVAMHSR